MQGPLPGWQADDQDDAAAIDTATVLTQVGPRLREARLGRGLTLDELSALVDISASTLSRLESGKRQATLELLLPVTRQLGISIDELVPTETRDPRVKESPIERYGLTIQPLTPASSAIRVFKITYPPRSVLPEPRVHDGYDWLFVLSGKLSLRLGERVFTLSRGEAAEFDTRTPHSMAATGTRAAEVITIFSEAGVRMHTESEA